MQTQCIQFHDEHSSGSALELAAAAHDLRNRIGVAGCEVHLLRRNVAVETAVVAEYLASLERTLRAATDQLENVIELICADAYLPPATHTPKLDLVELITDVVAHFRATYGVSALTFTSSMPSIREVLPPTLIQLNKSCAASIV